MGNRGTGTKSSNDVDRFGEFLDDYTVSATCRSWPFQSRPATIGTGIQDMAPLRVAITSRYSASTSVVPSVARLCEVHKETRSLRRCSCPFASSDANARDMGP